LTSWHAIQYFSEQRRRSSTINMCLPHNFNCILIRNMYYNLIKKNIWFKINYNVNLWTLDEQTCSL